jgi:hypothetical protein
MAPSWKSLLLYTIICGLYACSATKYVPDGEYLLDKTKIRSDVKDFGPMELNHYIRQQPNFRMFALNKTTFQIYNLSGKDSSKWYNRFLKKIGEKPVIFDSTLVGKSKQELSKLLVNKGYVNVEVSSEIIKKNKRAEVIYTIRGNKPYRVGNYSRSNVTTTEKKLLSDTVSTPPSPETSLINKGMLFDRAVLDAERDRISLIFRNQGYYHFNRNHISFIADSALNNNTVNLRLSIDPLQSDKTTGSPFAKYHIDKVGIYQDFDPIKMTGIQDYNPSDSCLSPGGYVVYYKGKRPAIRAGTLIENCYIKPGSTYSQKDEDATYSAISSLGAISNIQIHFEPFLRNDSNLLQATILTMPSRRLSLTYSVEGLNTAGNLGISTSVGSVHRNLFRGSEILTFKVSGAYETISNFDNPYLEFGFKASVDLPKLLFPFTGSPFGGMRTSTGFSLSYNTQARPEYSRTLFSGGLHYTVQGRDRTAGRHRFDLLDINYAYLPRRDSVFMSRLPSGAQYFGYTDHFIAGMGYSYTKTTFNPMKRERDAYSLRFQAESSGTLLYGLVHLFGPGKSEDQVAYELFKTYFAQFVKCDVDYSRIHSIDSHNSLAWRAFFGAGFPYGNSGMLPFERRYYSGGANSVRAWTVRELGPGHYLPNDSTTFFNQSGDIKLDLSIEYRTRFFWKFEAAAFIDAGNIWTVKDYPGQEGGKFEFGNFYKEIAVGHGLGLRLDVNFFLIRFDCGWRTYDPSLRGSDAWTVFRPNFSSNWAWHVAVGYPF